MKAWKKALAVVLTTLSITSAQAQSVPVIPSNGYAKLLTELGILTQYGHTLENEGLKNVLKNNGFEIASTNWTATPASTITYITSSSQAANVGYGKQALAFDATATSQTVVSDVITYPNSLMGIGGVGKCSFKTTASDYKLQVYLNGALSQEVVIPASAYYLPSQVTFSFPTSGVQTAQMRFVSQSNAAVLYIDECFLGEQAPTQTSTFSASALPMLDATYDLGSLSQRWRDLFISRNAVIGNNLTVSSLGTGVLHSNSSGAITSSLVVNADVSSSAAITRSKLATGSANEIVVNDGSGNLSSVAVLNVARGGTGLSSTGTADQFLRTNGAGTALEYDTITSDDIPEGSTNLYATSSSVRAAISASAPLQYNSSSGVMSIPQATSSSSGYLLNTDWQAFNAKQPAGSYITSLTGEVTASGPGAAAATVANSAVIAKVLTGLSLASSSSVVATDTIVEAFGKLENRMTTNDAKVSGFPDPMTTDGDLIIRDAGTTTRLGLGAEGQVLTVYLGEPVWRNNPAGFTNPMVDPGDMIYNDASSSAAALPIGTNGDVLTVVAGLPAWQASNDANRSLSNLSSVAINTSLLPGVDDSIDLGSATFQWQDLFLAGDITNSSYSTGILHSNASGLISSSLIMDADVSSSAQVQRSKLADGTPYAVIANSSSGVMSEIAPANIGALVTDGAGIPSIVASSADGQVLRRSSSSVSFGLLDNTNLSSAASIQFTQLQSSTANTYTYFNSSGVIASLPNWSVQSWYGPSSNLTVVTPADAGDVFPGVHRHEMEIDPAVTTAQFHPQGFTLNGHFDRTGSGNDMNDLTWFGVSTSHEGLGTIVDYRSVGLSETLGAGTGGEATNYTHLATGTTVQPNFTVNSYTGVSHNANFDSSSVVNNANLVNITQGGPLSGNLNSILVSSNGDVGGNQTGLSIGLGGDTVGNLQGIVVNTSGDTGGATGLSLSIGGATHTGQIIGENINLPTATTTGKVGHSLVMGDGVSSGGGRFVEWNAGSGTYTNWIGLNLNHNAIDAGGSETSINVGKSSVDSLNYTGINFGQNGPASTSFTGINLSSTPSGTTADYKGIQIAPGSSTVTSSVSGIGVDLSQIVTTSQKSGLTIGDGVLSVQSNYDTGIYSASPGQFQHNILGGNFHVASGSPMTNTFGFGNNLGHQILVEDDVGPDTTGVRLGYSNNGFVHQVSVTSGSTMDTLNEMAAGAGIPPSSTGGTIDQMTMFRAIGLLPSGGTLTVNNMYGFRADSLLCGLASSCWGIWVNDTAADNWLAKDLVIGGSTGVPQVASVVLEANGPFQLYDGAIGVERRDESSAATLTAMVSTNGFVKLTATVTDIQGIVAGRDGQKISIYNATGGNVVLADEDLGATAADRLHLPGGTDITLTADQSVQLIYDTGQSRWVVEASPGTSGSGTEVRAQAIYPFVIGSAGEVSSGAATHTTFSAAQTAASDGDRITWLRGTFVENITVSKQLKLDGLGHGSILDGTVTFANTADYSSLKDVKVTGTVTVNSGADGIVVRDIWLDTGETLVDNGSGNLLEAIVE